MKPSEVRLTSGQIKVVGPLTADQLRELKAMHRRLWGGNPKLTIGTNLSQQTEIGNATN